MVGLVGLLKMDKCIININDLLLKMCKVLKHERWLKTNYFSDDNIGLGRVYLGIVNPETQPIFNEDKSLLIMMEGEVFGYQTIKDELIAKGHKFTINNDPEFVLHCYEEYGQSMMNFLNGTFIIALWDKNKDKLLLINDRYGARTLYYALNNGCLLFGSEVKAILEDKTFERIVNDEAVFDFFRWGFLLGNKTFFQGITLLPPASILECEHRKLKITRYWYMNFKEDYGNYPEEYYIAKLEKLILQAIQKQTDKNQKQGIFLSGGLDSRTIAAAMHKNDPNFKFAALTFGKKPHCDDARYAYAISKKLGIPNHFFTISSDYLASYSEKIVYITDGIFPCSDAHEVSVYGLMRRFCEIASWGVLIDNMFSFLRKDFLKLSRNTVIHKIFDEFYINFDKKMLQKLFTPDYYSQNADLGWKSFKNVITKIKCERSANIYSHFNMIQRASFTYRSLELRRNYFECRTPFLDNDLVDFFLTIPPKLRADAYLYSKTLNKLSPDLARIPWQKTGIGLYVNRFQAIFHRIGRKLLELMFKLIRKIFFYRINVRNYRKEFHDYDEWIRKNKRVKKYFLDILIDSKTLSRKYFESNYIKKLVELHMSGKEDYSKQLTLLLTFELWNRQFLDDAITS